MRMTLVQLLTLVALAATLLTVVAAATPTTGGATGCDLARPGCDCVLTSTNTSQCSTCPSGTTAFSTECVPNPHVMLSPPSSLHIFNASDSSLSCPAGHACVLNCGGFEQCANTTVTCGDGTQCSVACLGTMSCKDLSLDCSGADASCALECVGPSSCLRAATKCGSGPCVRSCPGMSTHPLPVLPTPDSNGFVASSCEPSSSPLAIAHPNLNCTERHLGATSLCMGLLAVGEFCDAAAQCSSGLCVNNACCGSEVDCCPASESAALDVCHRCAGVGYDREPGQDCVANAVVAADPAVIPVFNRSDLSLWIDTNWPQAITFITINGAPARILAATIVSPTQALVNVSVRPSRTTGAAAIRVGLGVWGDVIQDDGSAVLAFAGSDCSSTGEYRDRSQCSACPTGAQCPGNDRVWPLPGYWNAGEGSDYVARCPEPDLCLGGPSAACAAGHSGVLCLRCTSGFYHRTWTRCTACASGSYVLLAILLGFAVSFALVTAVVPDLAIPPILSTVLVGQSIYAVGAGVSESAMPDVALSIYEAAKLFGLDYTFTRPGCRSTGLSYVALFFTSLTYVAVFAALPIAIACAMRITLSEKAAMMFRARAVKLGLAVMFLVYTPCVRFALDALNCVQTDTALAPLLVADPQIKCYQGHHIFVSMFGWVLVFNVAFGFPVVLYIVAGILLGARSDLYTDQAFEARYSLIVSRYHPSSLRRVYAVMFFVRQLVVLAAGVLLDSTRLSSSIAVLALLLSAAAMGLSRPFTHWVGWVDGIAALVPPFLFAVLNVLESQSSVLWFASLGVALGAVCVTSAAHVLGSGRESAYIAPVDWW